MVDNWNELERWVAALPDQRDRARGELCVQFYLSFDFPEGMEAHFEDKAARQMWGHLNSYFEPRTGPIVWRLRPHLEFHDAHIVEKFDPDGPDYDYLTDKKCYLKKGWKALSARCRVYREVAKVPVHA